MGDSLRSMGVYLITVISSFCLPIGLHQEAIFQCSAVIEGSHALFNPPTTLWAIDSLSKLEDKRD